MIAELTQQPNDHPKIVRFTPAGASFLRDASEALAEIWRDYAALLGEDELRRLQAALDELAARVRR